MLVDASTVVNAWRRVEGMPISLPLVATDTGGGRAPVTGGVLGVEAARQLARLCKALGDPTRVRLLSMITAQSGGEACVCDLTEPVGLSQPTVSHHMKQLVDAGLVTREQRGRWRSEEHTSELQSRGHLVCRLLLEKKIHKDTAR